jgi:hypothetical protein
VSGAASTSQSLPLTVRRIVLCVMLPGVLVALQKFAPDASEDTVCVQTCKRRDPALQRCPLYEQRGEANEFLCGNREF